MTKDEALDLALEALEESVDLVREDYENAKKLYSNYPSRQARLLGMEDGLLKHEAAVAAIKQALANEALDKMAENARELGLDYEPAPVLYQLPDDLYDSKDWKVGSYAERVEWLHTMYEAKKRELEYCLDAAPVQEPVAFFDWYDNAHWGNEDFKEGCHRSWNAAINYATPPAAQDLQTELEATNRQVEILSDALAESRREVAALKAVQEQPVLIPASLADKQFERYYRQGYDAGFAAQRQSEWVGLSHDEFRDFASTFEYGTGGLIRAIEAKLKAKNSL